MPNNLNYLVCSIGYSSRTKYKLNSSLLHCKLKYVYKHYITDFQEE